MSEEGWIPYDGKIYVGDVWSWREPAWKPTTRKKSKRVIIGERSILAQLTKVDGDWLEFVLMSCKTKNAETWWKFIPELKADKPLRRHRKTLAKRKPERRPWGDSDGEPARATTVSKFLNKE
jgi:hypothetical protein